MKTGNQFIPSLSGLTSAYEYQKRLFVAVNEASITHSMRFLKGFQKTAKMELRDYITKFVGRWGDENAWGCYWHWRCIS